MGFQSLHIQVCLLTIWTMKPIFTDVLGMFLPHMLVMLVFMSCYIGAKDTNMKITPYARRCQNVLRSRSWSLWWNNLIKRPGRPGIICWSNMSFEISWMHLIKMSHQLLMRCIINWAHGTFQAILENKKLKRFTLELGLPKKRSFWLTHVNNKWFSSWLLFGNCFLHLLQVKASAVKSWWQSVKWFHCSASLTEIGILQYEQKSRGKLVKLTCCCRCCDWWLWAWGFEFHIFWAIKVWPRAGQCSRTDQRQRTNENFS